MNPPSSIFHLPTFPHTLTALLLFLLLFTAGCFQTEVRRDNTALQRLSGLHGGGPDVQATVNRMPDPVRANPNLAQPIPLAPAQPPDNAPVDLDPAKQAAAEAAALLHPPVIWGHLTCRAFDPVTRRPLQVAIRALADNKRFDFVTDAARGLATVDLPVGRVRLFCAAGEFYTPYANQIDLQPGDNSVDVLLTQVPELNPARCGFVSLTFARTARQDFTAARLRCAVGQPDWAVVLGDPAPAPANGWAAVDGPYARTGSRFAGIGLDTPPILATGPRFAPPAAPRARSNDSDHPPTPLQSSIAPAWDDLHRLRQAGFLRLWLYPAGRETDPQLARLLNLPDRQYRGPEGWLAAERGPGLELVTLGAHGEGETEYFTLLNRGLPVVAIAEPLEADRASPPAAALARPRGLIDENDPATYQTLPADLYAAALTPRTLIRVGRFNAAPQSPTPAETLQWLRAGVAQVCYGPVLNWKIREFADVVGYPAQPIPAADRLYHLDLTAFVGPGAPPESRSIQLIELLRNGQVVARLPIDRPLQSVRDLTFEIRESARCWYMLRAYTGPAADNRHDTRAPQPHWRISWSSPIHFAAVGDTEIPVYERRSLPVRIHAFRALDNTPADAVAILSRGGFLIQKVALPKGRGELTARVGDHILVGGPAWQWRETIVSPYENQTGDPWRNIDAEPLPPANAITATTTATAPNLASESAAAANARLSGLGLICPLTPRAPDDRTPKPPPPPPATGEQSSAPPTIPPAKYIGLGPTWDEIVKERAARHR